MFAILAVLLTIYARAVKKCECGGTLEDPIPDRWLCDDLKPPGMELREPERSFNLYSVLFTWFMQGGNNYVAVHVCGTGSYTFYGYILQGRVDNKPMGMFVSSQEPGTTLNCEPFSRNTWYYVNISYHTGFGEAYWLPMNSLGGKLTMHTTIITDRNTYYQLVDNIPFDPRLKTTYTTTTTSASNTTETDSAFPATATNTTFGVQATESNTKFATAATTNTRASTSVTLNSSSVQSVTSKNTRPQETTL